MLHHDASLLTVSVTPTDISVDSGTKFELRYTDYSDTVLPTDVDLVQIL